MPSFPRRFRPVTDGVIEEVFPVPSCTICDDTLSDLGALVFSPPKEDLARKWHVCTHCYMTKLLPILTGGR
jgi:hypothetical protein